MKSHIILEPANLVIVIFLGNSIIAHQSPSALQILPISIPEPADAIYELHTYHTMLQHPASGLRLHIGTVQARKGVDSYETELDIGPAS
jgi:hypothetical protein